MPDDVHGRQVGVADFDDVGAQHLDHHAVAVVQARAVHLADGGGGHRLLIELGETLRDRPQVLLDDGADAVDGHARHLVAQAGQLLGDLLRQDVAAGGDELPGLDHHAAGAEGKAPEFARIAGPAAQVAALHPRREGAGDQLVPPQQAQEQPAEEEQHLGIAHPHTQRAGAAAHDLAHIGDLRLGHRANIRRRWRGLVRACALRRGGRAQEVGLGVLVDGRPVRAVCAVHAVGAMRAVLPAVQTDG
jgi:hypothetical protein